MQINSSQAHPEAPARWPVDLVIDTHLLHQRPSKPADHRAESAALLQLVQTLAAEPQAVAQRLVETAMQLTGAGSSGLSIVDSENGTEVFRWIATAGEYARYLRGTMPRHFSPCGEVLRRAEPLLIRGAVRAFPYIESLHVAPEEVLLVPFARDGTLIGTVWVVKHAEDHCFDLEDLRVVTSLSAFASAVSATVGLVRDLEAQGDALARELARGEQQRQQLDRLIAERDLGAAAMQRELNDTRRLHEVAARLIGVEGDQALFGEILDAALEITGADAGTIQLHDPQSGTLSFLATRGFKPDIVEHFARVDASSGSPCGVALATGQRSFVGFGEHLPDPDGSNRWHREAGVYCAQSTPLVSRGGRPLGMFSTHWREQRELSEREVRFLDLLGRQAADLIERMQVQDALLASERELREGARRKDEFLAVLAHELRNPLAPIRTSVELLKKAARDPVIDKVRPIMERQVNHMVRLIDDLLDVSRITSGKVELRRESVDLKTLIDAVVETNRAAIAAAGLELQLDIDQPHRTLHVDPTRMSQVLSNILHNATKFTGRGGLIRLSTAVTSGGDGTAPMQVFKISDDGLGIAADALPTVFDLFTQVRPDSSHRHGGLGIGLSLTRSFVELHGGTVSAASAGPGHGSTFTVCVPVGFAAPEKQARTQLAEARVFSGLRVLVVDDNADAADALGQLLTLHGSDVRVAYDAAVAVDLLPSFKPAWVLLDIGMPGIDGYEACRRMRAHYGGDLRIIALTGWGQESDRQRAAEAGFDAHLTKPVDLMRLAALATKVDAA